MISTIHYSLKVVSLKWLPVGGVQIELAFQGQERRCRASDYLGSALKMTADYILSITSSNLIKFFFSKTLLIYQ